MASAKLANRTVNQSQRLICTENPMPPAPVKVSRMRNTVVSAAPTSTTNITGFFSKVNGFNFAKDALAARPTISGSNNGRDRASFFGIREAGSVWGTLPAGLGSVVTVDI